MDDTNELDFLDELNQAYEEALTTNNDGSEDADKLLSELNPEQREAVKTIDGPLLILAGAGSGKTRVITYRIAYMIKKHKIYPGSIMAITFTNKAANEMRSRIAALVGEDAKYIWCGTFHSIFARILRRHADLLGYDKNFKIIDTDDQLKVIKESLKELNYSDKTYSPRAIQSVISDAKNKMMSVAEFSAYSGTDPYYKCCALVFKKYETKLKQNNAMDFDDILLNTVKLFRENPDVLNIYHRRFKYFMVDEYQDTNNPQYEAVKLLSSYSRNICVVGDDDQSIYAFRGANVQVILNFEKDFENAVVVKLEENYRSTQTILDAANEVIANNKYRKDKCLRTSNEKGSPIIVMNAESQIDEANFTANMIKTFVNKNQFKYSDMAVLFRMNSLSRSIEIALREAGIPYKIFGGTRFYDRKEIKDVIAYLRLIMDDKDDLAFGRIINVPARGIGTTSVDRIHELAVINNTSSMSICKNVDMYPELSRAASKIKEFVQLIEMLRNMLALNELSFDAFVEEVQNKSGIIDEIIREKEKKNEVTDRVENLKELLSEAIEFEKKARVTPEEAASAAELKAKANVEENPDGEYDDIENQTADTLAGLLNLYLTNVALYSEGDNYTETDDFVKMMSIHSSKGLEFGAVFLVGLEESIFPSYKSQTEKELEEERRLMYVAITRAKKKLMILLSQRRTLFGQTQVNPPSRFLKEISPEHLYKMGHQRPKVQEDTAMPKDLRKQSQNQIASALSTGFLNGAKATNIRTGSKLHAPSRPDLNSPKTNKPSGSIDIFEVKEGLKIVHPRFGDGVVIKCEPVAGDLLLSLDFDGMRKNLLLSTSGIKKA